MVYHLGLWFSRNYGPKIAPVYRSVVEIAPVQLVNQKVHRAWDIAAVYGRRYRARHENSIWPLYHFMMGVTFINILTATRIDKFKELEDPSRPHTNPLGRPFWRKENGLRQPCQADAIMT
eukprot:GILJ01000593.1.p2 GENE.GILJ01000593.1~~GILJ01000593.1.p2  ORF type:complete len:134 (+),score=15.94 GILJ01000593.1:43-402(+)